jgi:hypothetical protein
MPHNPLLNLFPGQQDSEKVYLVVREHWFLLLFRVAIWFLFIAVLFAFDHYAAIYMPRLLEEPYVYYVSVLKNIFLIYVVYALFLLWSLYHLSYQVVTNERVVDVTQSSIFNHSIAELHLINIEDVTAETKGLFGTIVGYGNVYIQTAGTKEHFIFNNVPAPDKVAKLILDLYQHEKDENGHHD